MKTLILKTQTNTYEVIINENGTLSLYLFADKNREPFENTGQVIFNKGGVNNLLKECEVIAITFAEYLENEQKEKKAKKDENLQKIVSEYEDLLEKNKVIEANETNIGIVLRYLNTHNWGFWELPKMSVGYSAAQYDCEGKLAS